MISIEAPAYIPFEPRTEALRALRQHLRERLADLVTDHDEILGARIFGPLPRGADVENALLYNVDSGGRAFAQSTGSGVRFEHDPAPLPGGGVRYEYGADPAEAEFRIWTPSRGLADLSCRLDDPPSLATIWWGLREDGHLSVEDIPRQPGEPFGVQLILSGPARHARPSLVKTLIDGVVCALQSQTDRQDAELTAPRIAAALGVEDDRVREHLLDPTPSALGTRARLVHSRGAGVQWAPDDDGCVAGEVLLLPDRRWRIDGSVFALARR